MKPLILLFTLLILYLNISKAQTLIAEKGENGLYGYIDDCGEWVIEPKYRSASDFSEGFGFVRIDNKYAYINEKGKEIYIAPCDIYFSKYANIDGERELSPSCDSSFVLGSDFKEGLGVIKVNGKYGYIDTLGNTTITPQFQDARNFNEGLAVVKKNGKYGYIDKFGKTKIPFNYDRASGFSDGKAHIKVDDDFFFIDKKGAIIIKSPYNLCSDYSDGLIIVRGKNRSSKYGVIDKFWNLIIDLKYEYLGNFSEGLASFTQNSMSGFMDTKGNIVIPPTFNTYLLGSFKNGVAHISENLYIDKKGNKYPNKISYFKKNALPEKRLKNYVTREIEKWQKKDEFESTVQYLKRVNDSTIHKKAQELFDFKLKELKQEEIENLHFSMFQLESYDADNQTFLITSEKFGNLIIPIKKEFAKEFKDNWYCTRIYNPEFILNDGKFQLTKINFILPPDNLKRYYISNIDKIDSFTNRNDIISFVKSNSDANELLVYKLKKEEVFVNISKLKEFNLKYPLSTIVNPKSSIKNGFIASYNSNKKTDYNIFDLNISLKLNYNSIIEKQNIKSQIDINKSTPISSKKNNNAYALFIGNEDYQKYQSNLKTEQNVEFAKADAELFAKYAENALGIPKENITLLKDATSAQLKREIAKLSKLAEKTGNEAELIFYYAGHGLPKENTNEAFLIPVDVTASNIEDGISLSNLFQQLTTFPCKKVTVFLDACFSGGGRNLGLFSSRGIKVVPKYDVQKGNLVVFASSKGDQSSLPYIEMGHGLFTYHLLKKLQENNSHLTYGDLADYLMKQVSIDALRINGKEQDPNILWSIEADNQWRNWIIIDK